jgi:hypothetical protein
MTLDELPDADFLAAFETLAIDIEKWSHRCHVRMAYLYLRDHGYEEGLRRIRDGIQALNASHGDKIPKDKVDRGYHETMTVAWAQVVDATIRRWGPEADFAAFAEIHGYLLHKRLLRLYYSTGRILTWDAKRTSVEPDLGPLPAGG